MNAKKLVKGLVGVVQLLSRPLLPLSEKEKQEYVRRVEEKRDFYQPRIEEKTRVDLGKVFVLPTGLGTAQIIYDKYTQLSNIANTHEIEKFSWPQRTFIKAIAPITAAPITAIMSIPWLYHMAKMEQKAAMMAVDDCIFVPFGYISRFNLIMEKMGDPSDLDELVVHELSHILWSKLAQKHKQETLPPRLISEGFATYCQQNFFSDLYPKNYIIDEKTMTDSYLAGKKKIENLVAKYGKDIVLKIPARWPYFIEQMEN